MIFTFFAVIVWIENHNLSSLIQAEEKIQKCPQKGYWTIAVIIGIILSVIAWFMFPSYEEVHYDAYFIWIIGGFLILTFGMGVLLEEIKKDLPGKIGKFELPQYIEIWKEEDIPVTGNGKVRKKALRQIFEDKLKNN